MDEIEDVLSHAATLASFFIFYCVVAVVVRSIFEAPPKDISDKEVYDYYGQHVSLIHSVLAVIAASCVYIYEGGIDYHLPTLPRHSLVMYVMAT